MTKKGLDLSYSLFGVQVSEGRASKTGRAIENETFCFSIEAALREDGAHAF
jgi:hypothetical protein